MKFYLKLIVLFVTTALFVSSPSWAESAKKLTISGSVNNPFTIETKNLSQFKSIDVQLNEITSDKGFKGAFVYHGVSLKILLELADVEKKDTDFKKQVDLAVIVKTKDGKSVALSWGEIFYKNPQNVMIAISADPIFPHKGIDHFADKAAYDEMMKTLKREVGFPKLVITGDFYTDRCIENVSEIIVYDLRPKVPGKKSPTVHSEKFDVTGDVKKPVTIEKLDDFPHVDIASHIVGEGRGYHGTKVFSGVSLKQILDTAAPNLDLNTVFMLSAPDAYRVLISYGELYLNPHGNRILITDAGNGKPFDNGGKFILVLCDDLMADRELKAVRKIDVIQIPK